MAENKLYKLIVLLCLVLSNIGVALSQQDVWLQSYALPVSGCGLSNSQLVRVSILNNSPTPMVFNTITAYYNIDAGPITSQTIGATLAGNASINFTFNVNANLSACGPHVVKVWVARPNDPNQNNDTLQWTIQNDCPIIPGDILSTTTVCASNNSGVLNLAGWSNGTISQWQNSINGGATWLPISNTTTTLNYSNVSQNTIYRVQFSGGLCPNAVSDTAQITVVAPPSPGTLSGATSLCITNSTGILNLTGTTATVLSWESSTNGGTTWTTIPNTTYSNYYSNLTSSTLYRVLLAGNVCPNVYSNTVLITIDPVSGPGVLSGSDSFCAPNATGSISVAGNIGSVLNWESSVNNGISWTNITNTATTLNYTGLTQTTWYRAFTQGNICPNIYSDTAIITVQSASSVPDIIGTDSLCITNVNGNLIMPVGYNILDWETASTNSGPWSSLSSNSAAMPFSGLTNTQYFRVLIDGDQCPDYYSNIGVVYVEQLTDPGTTSENDTLCISNPNGTVVLTGNIGPVDYWQFSTDSGSTWQTITNNSTSYNYSNLISSTMFRAYTNGGYCPSYYSDTVEIIIADSINIGSIIGDGLYCEEALIGSIDILGSLGSITSWETSINNGLNWTSTSGSSTSYPYSNVTTTTWYRAFFESEFCPDKYSDIAIIAIDPTSNAGLPLPSTSICEGDETSITLIGNTGSNLIWQNSFDGITWNTISGATSTTLQLPNVISTEYFRVILSSGICPPDTSNAALITINPIPLITISEDATITEGDTTTLLGVGGLSGNWSPDINISNLNINNPIVFPTETMYYVYSVTGANGCSNADSVLITVLAPTFFDIKNVVTRNGDGYNDFWFIEGIENYPNTEVHIFNMYGNEIYSNPNYNNEWEGKLKGKNLPNGTYYYVVRFAEADQDIKGTILLLGDD